MADETKKEAKKKIGNEIRILIVLGVLTAILVLGIVIVNSSKPKGTFEAGGFTITPVKIEGTTRTYYSFPIAFSIGSSLYNGSMLLKIDPRLLDNVSVNVNSKYFASRASIIILFDPEIPSRVVESMVEIKRVNKLLNIPIGMAITHESNESNSTVAIMSCDESRSDQRIIYLNPNANETRVYENGCVTVEGNGFDELEKATDALVFKWMQAIKAN
jgi:hypothetical protein